MNEQELLNLSIEPQREVVDFASDQPLPPPNPTGVMEMVASLMHLQSAMEAARADRLERLLLIRDKNFGLDKLVSASAAIQSSLDDSHDKMHSCMQLFDKYHQQMKE